MHEAFAPFGPLIYRGDIRGEFNNFLLKHLDSIRQCEDARNMLVGNIEQQRRTNYPQKEFVDFVDVHVVNYLRDKYQHQLSIDRNIFGGKQGCKNGSILNPDEHEIRYHLGEGPWVNFSKKGEFNPMHNHSGVISSVVFIDIPEEIEQERDSTTFSAKAAGCLDLIMDNQHIVVKPVSGTIYLFPSYLWHLVYPFHSDVERISMSFNIYDLTLDDNVMKSDSYKNYGT